MVKVEHHDGQTIRYPAGDTITVDPHGNLHVHDEQGRVVGVHCADAWRRAKRKTKT